MQKITAALVLSIIALSFSSIWSADAFAINWSLCYAQPNHHCMTYANKVPLSTSTSLNWQFNAMLPDGTCNITGIQLAGGGCSAPMVVLSSSNYTLAEQAPVLEAMENIAQTGSNPTTGYCPFGYYTLTHQGTDINLLYNATSGLDLTGFVYPPQCYIETGPNPIDNNGATTVPEFGDMVNVLLFVGIIITILISSQILGKIKYATKR